MLYTIAHKDKTAWYQTAAKRVTIARRFFSWCTTQDQEHHIAWAGVSLIAMAAVFFPLTMGVILIHGAAFGFIVPAMISLILVFTLNLSAQSTRITLPALVLAIAIDLLVIITCTVSL
ncbi:MAG: hypothetical protein ABIQ88_01505 [Chitinophagaceae bacterium]